MQLATGKHGQVRTNVAQPQSAAKISPMQRTWGQSDARVRRSKVVMQTAAPDVSTQMAVSSNGTDVEEAWHNISTRFQSAPQRQLSEPKVVGPADYHPSQGWMLLPHHLSKDQIWKKMKEEAKHDADSEPTLASFLYSSILGHHTFEKTLAFILANKLASATLYSTQLMKIIDDCYKEEPAIIEACIADLQAVFDRDPACEQYTQCLLYFKGFQALQCHRIAHYLWGKGRKLLAVALQSRISEAFHVDIHPAASFGRGVMLDHATGVVIGETAVVGDNVSMLHHVTLGGSGTGKGIRHPTIGHGVLLGAGVSVLGSVTVGCGAKVGAGSVVVNDLPCYSVAVGVPARIVKQNPRLEPCQDMDQTQDFILDYVI